MIKENQKEEFKAVFIDNFRTHFNSSNFNLYENNDELTIECSKHIKKIALNSNNLNIRFYDDSFKDVINKIFEVSALEIGLKKNNEVKKERKLKL